MCICVYVHLYSHTRTQTHTHRRPSIHLPMEGSISQRAMLCSLIGRSLETRTEFSLAYRYVFVPAREGKFAIPQMPDASACLSHDRANLRWEKNRFLIICCKNKPSAWHRRDSQSFETFSTMFSSFFTAGALWSFLNCVPVIFTSVGITWIINDCFAKTFCSSFVFLIIIRETRWDQMF